MKKYSWNVTLSAGIVTYKKPPKSVDEMIRFADNVMYSVKKHGKNNLKHIALD
ncbi:MAG: diguanylate cyclase [Chitinispirillaceae bacterium]|jgi:PleD family two-component response regulator